MGLMRIKPGTANGQQNGEIKEGAMVETVAQSRPASHMCDTCDHYGCPGLLIGEVDRSCCHGGGRGHGN